MLQLQAINYKVTTNNQNKNINKLEKLKQYLRKRKRQL